MADIDVSRPNIPQGIPTFEMIFNAVDKLMKRVDKLEEKISKLEITPQPVTNVEAVDKIEEKKAVKK